MDLEPLKLELFKRLQHGDKEKSILL